MVESEERKSETGPHVGELKEFTTPILLPDAKWKQQLE